MPSFYLPELDENTRFARISGEEFHHLSHVFRKKADDEILLTNGKGVTARARIIDIGKKNARIEILETERKVRSSPHIAAAFSLLKNKHDHLIVEKLTELGVREFYPVIFKNSVRKNSGNTVEKLMKVAVAAIK